MPGTINESFLLVFYTVGCEPPSINFNSSIPEASLVVYYCGQGLLSTEPMIAVCMADGIWEPDLAQLECTDSEQPPGISLRVLFTILACSIVSVRRSMRKPNYLHIEET